MTEVKSTELRDDCGPVFLSEYPTDVVGWCRLRQKEDTTGVFGGHLFGEAADEIESLRRQLAETEQNFKECYADYQSCGKELHRKAVQLAEVEQRRDELVKAAVMAVEMIEENAHERRHVRWALKDAIAKAGEQK